MDRLRDEEDIVHHRARWLSALASLSVVALTLLHAQIGDAVCNAIPAAEARWARPSSNGHISHPLAVPGSVVELVRKPCDGEAAFFLSGDQVTLHFDASSPASSIAIPQPANAPELLPCDIDTVGNPGLCSSLTFELVAVDEAGGGPHAGPARITVTRAGAEIARIDELAAPTPGCDKSADTAFSRFVVLPAPNDYADLVAPGPGETLRATVDGLGTKASLLVPFRYDGVLPPPGADPVGIMLQGHMDLPVAAGKKLRKQVGGHKQSHADYTLESFTLKGIRLPTLVQITAQEETPEVLGLADASVSVLRLPARNGAVYDASPYAGTALPIEVPASDFALSVWDPLLLETLRVAGQNTAYVVPEAYAGDRDGDGVLDDEIVQLLDASTGFPAPNDSNTQEKLAGQVLAVTREWTAFAAYTGSDPRLEVFDRSGHRKTPSTPISVATTTAIDGQNVGIGGDRVFALSPGTTGTTLTVFAAQSGQLVCGGVRAEAVAVAGDSGRALFLQTAAGASVPSLWLFDPPSGGSQPPGCLRKVLDIGKPASHVVASDRFAAFAVPEALFPDEVERLFVLDLNGQSLDATGKGVLRGCPGSGCPEGQQRAAMTFLEPSDPSKHAFVYLGPGHRLVLRHPGTGKEVELATGVTDYEVDGGRIAFRRPGTSGSSTVQQLHVVWDPFPVGQAAATNTGWSAVSCSSHPCPAGRLYFFANDHLWFVSSELEEGRDLDGNGVIAGDVLVGLRPGASSPAIVQTIDLSALAAQELRLEPLIARTDLAGKPLVALPVFEEQCVGAIPSRARACGVEPGRRASASLRLGLAGDLDEDGSLDPFDGCPDIANPLQVDADRDALGGACDPDPAACATVPLDGCRAADVEVATREPEAAGRSLEMRLTLDADPALPERAVEVSQLSLCGYEQSALRLVARGATLPSAECAGSPCWQRRWRQRQPSWHPPEGFVAARSTLLRRLEWSPKRRGGPEPSWEPRAEPLFAEAELGGPGLIAEAGSVARSLKIVQLVEDEGENRRCWQAAVRGHVLAGR